MVVVRSGSEAFFVVVYSYEKIVAMAKNQSFCRLLGAINNAIVVKEKQWDELMEREVSK